jgi:segregation and condensation protein A
MANGLYLPQSGRISKINKCLITMEDLYKIKLPVFEGPLDLLLHLIRDNKIDIYDIPIAFITHRYLEYIEIMKELDLEIAGDFLVMAATLIHIKSRMLLPVDEEVPEEHIEDPRLELVQRLLEYQTFKDGASILREKEEERRKVFVREPSADGDEEGDVPDELYLFEVNIFDLLGAFKKILEKAPEELMIITREVLTVKDKILLIVEMIENHETIRFEDLFKDSITKLQLIVTFLALLEVLRLGLARVYQEKEFGNIWIINPHKRDSETPL